MRSGVGSWGLGQGRRNNALTESFIWVPKWWKAGTNFIGRWGRESGGVEGLPSVVVMAELRKWACSVLDQQ